MSLRLRILAFVALVAFTAIGATAYLAYLQTSRQVTEDAVADRQVTNHVVERLTRYAQEHGTWEFVPATVDSLAKTTGQRIKLVTEWDEVIVDSDTLAGRTARGVVSPPVLADPRPAFTLPLESIQSGGKSAAEITMASIQQYRSGVRFAACLTRQHLPVEMSLDQFGVPTYTAERATALQQPQTVDACRSGQDSPAALSADANEVLACYVSKPEVISPEVRSTQTRDCLQKTFAVRSVDVAPVPLRVYLGALGEPVPRLTPIPVIAAALLVAVLALAGTILLSRRVLRPVAQVTRAAERLGQGDLSQWVPDGGGDELAMLARSFNHMADSLRKGEDRQRRLVADVAHELRTPLANLRGYLEALKDGVLPASPELFASLHEEAVWQQRIVDDLQDLALAEAGVLTYHRTRVDLAELVEVCGTAHRPAAEAAGVTLTVQATGPVNVDADSDRLRQVVGNLVSNALRASSPGGSVTLTADPGPDGWAVLTVRDTGSGIAASDVPHVFDRFWRADGARGRKTGGSGLGLAIARQIVTDHGGRIGVQSELGAGTVMTVTVPLSDYPVEAPTVQFPRLLPRIRQAPRA
ncbi:sensor histidine kinase [Allorhizocola rhizosphaerae]|uniref:sensor histidine kinase n=1 Tax=Allorhizocola rhizosphaerae TaxID=1872709 RepID=UPI000E3B86BE|nr:ATP-binding protein [Allorhizocola rhizosphaerae]